MWRVNQIRELTLERSGQTRNSLTQLLNKFRFLRPDCVPESWMKRSGTNRKMAPDVMSRKFEELWKGRTSLNGEFDELLNDAKLTWTADDVFQVRQRILMF